MVCLSCRCVTSGALCVTCLHSMREAPDRYVDPGVLVRSGRSHEGAARNLVHRLKYDCVVAAALPLADAMLDRVAGATALVPIPRTVLRRLRYGIDPGETLAGALGRRTGIPVVRALGPALWAPQHAGTTRSGRERRRLRLVDDVPAGAILVDDVITTGMTIGEAARITGLKRAVTATSRGLGPDLRPSGQALAEVARMPVKQNPSGALKFGVQSSETPSD